MEQTTEKEIFFTNSGRKKKMGEKIESAVLRSFDSFEEEFERDNLGEYWCRDTDHFLPQNIT